MRHFAHHIGDYAAATAHLSFVEDAAYHRLLRRYYQDEMPLPPDIGAVCRLIGARTKDERRAVENVLAEFFQKNSDGYHQRRAEREIEIYRTKVETARENGVKGGRPRNPQKTHQVIPSEPNEKLTTPHSPLTSKDSSEAKASGADAPQDIASLIFGQGLAWLQKTSGKPRGNCASQLGKWRKQIGDEALISLLGRAQREGALAPMDWMEAAIRHQTVPKREPMQI